MDFKQGCNVIERAGNDEQQVLRKMQVGNEIVGAGHQASLGQHDALGFPGGTGGIQRIDDVGRERIVLHFLPDGLYVFLGLGLSQRHGHRLQVMHGAVGNNEVDPLVGTPYIGLVRLETIGLQGIGLGHDGIPQLLISNAFGTADHRYFVRRTYGVLPDAAFQREFGVHHPGQGRHVLEIAGRDVFLVQRHIVLLGKHV